MKSLRSLLILFLVVLSLQAQAQKWSYVYIQGDKQVPFYVKLEGEMLPRYGKNYCIIPRLTAGPVHIEILFQQNLFPPQSYTILVPDDGFRGFLLHKRESMYALYDIQQQTYLYPGGQDQLPDGSTTPPVTKVEPREQPPVTNPIADQPPVTQEIKDPPPVTKNNGEPNFINNVVLKDNTADTGAISLDREQKADTPGTMVQPGADNTEVEIVLESDTAPILNSDCPAPMGNEEYERMYAAASTSGKGDKLITYLLKKIEGNCYTTRQVFKLADLMDEEALIYLYLKRIFPRVTDQHNFHLLEQYLFESEEWSKAFRLIH